MKKLIGIAVLLSGFCCAWAATQEDDLISLARSGVEEEVLISYVDAAKGPYHLTPDQIIELKDLGVSSKVVSMALKHGEPANAETTPESTQEPSAAVENTGSSTDSAVAPPPPIASQESSPAPPESAAPSNVVVAPAPGDQNISFFYRALYPYGTWVNIGGQWCWKPNAATLDANWAPYCDNGYWANTDYGWTWVSNYSWGWAPFHYGRWYRRAGYGWLWMPGTEWGPAWVSFRTCNDYFGWAPLPPAARLVEHRGLFFNGRLSVGGVEFGLTVADYHFVPAGRFADREPWLYRLPPSRVHGFFNRTVILKDNYRFSHDRLFNAGPSVEVVSRLAGHRIDRVTIEPRQLREGEPIRGAIHSSRSLVLYKPLISRDAPESPIMIEKRLENGRGHSAVFPADKREAAISAAERDHRGIVSPAGHARNHYRMGSAQYGRSDRRAIGSRRDAEVRAEVPKDQHEESPMRERDHARNDENR